MRLTHIAYQRTSEHSARRTYFAPCRQRRWKIMGLLAVMLVVMVFLSFSTITASVGTARPAKDQPSMEGRGAGPDGVVVQRDQAGQAQPVDFDDLASRAAQGWPVESTVRIYRQQAVAADVPVCSAVGNQILQSGGTAADAVVAAAICAGVVHPYSSGLGGGALIMYYNGTDKTGHTIDAREVAPIRATEDMFVNEENSTVSPVYGWHSIAVPGELAGMWQLHQRYGKLPWKDLFQPAIKLAREGVTVTGFFARVLAYNQKYLVESFADSDMRRLFMNETTGQTYVEGDVVASPVLADTLEIIANDPKGIHEFYNGSIAQKLAGDIQKGGGIIQLADFAQYRVQEREPLSTKISDNMTLMGVGLPSGNVVLHNIFGTLKGYNYSKAWVSMTDDEKALFYHRFVEALKFGYARRSHLSDDLFVPGLDRFVQELLSAEYLDNTRRKISDEKTFEDPRHYGAQESGTVNQGGTAHISVIDKDGNAVAYSTSINTIFGSYRISRSTGIIFNNHMDDFKTSNKPNYFGIPPSEANKIEPGKRPQSSTCPLILIDAAGNVKLVAGASGGTRIISGLLNVLTRILFFGQDLKSALDAPRLHHQLIPMHVEYEKQFDKTHLESLKRKGHKVEESKAPYRYVYSAVEVIYVQQKGEIHAVADGRKGGLPDGV
ncbi:scoloptoxin SSD14-like isoform X2 [Paramacrobiotus metropolitanus]|uniref:scoloptoxin SSD14-like isoform X2 n=1 Tax=Paramacrobiotus metropolitanus TaxID=2943436 RepID=UPI0024461A5D|nr:scoloptoxin SSD14-like isoform X2 [Paramacrobiotus metropolitanus]